MSDCCKDPSNHKEKRNEPDNSNEKPKPLINRFLTKFGLSKKAYRRKEPIQKPQKQSTGCC